MAAQVDADWVAAVQIKGLLANCVRDEEEECKNYENLRDAWLLGCAQQGVAAVEKEVRLLTKWLLRLMLIVLQLCTSRLL